MPRRYLPLAAREVLYGEKTPRATLIEQGRLAFAEERYGAALHLFCRAADPEGLGRMKTLAIELGDAFMLRAVEEALPSLVTDADWKAVKAAAVRLGKESMVALADRYKGSEAAADVPPGGKPDAEA